MQNVRLRPVCNVKHPHHRSFHCAVHASRHILHMATVLRHLLWCAEETTQSQDRTSANNGTLNLISCLHFSRFTRFGLKLQNGTMELLPVSFHTDIECGISTHYMHHRPTPILGLFCLQQQTRKRLCNNLLNSWLRRSSLYIALLSYQHFVRPFDLQFNFN